MKKFLALICATAALWAVVAATSTSTASAVLHDGIASRGAQIEELAK